jgi:pimeloyl-ACP methyl ester carboxylesterase
VSPALIVVIALLTCSVWYVWCTVRTFVMLPVVQPAPQRPGFGTCEEFQVVTCDGRRIEGLIVRPSMTATGVAILCHPWGLSKERCFGVARILVESGHVAVLFDFRNCGQSETRRLIWPEPLDHGVLDLDAVMRHVSNNLPERHHSLALVGLSYGGNVALAYADRLTPAPHALVLDSTPLTPYTDFIATTLALTRARHPLGRLLRWTEPLSIWLIDTMLRGGRFYRRAIESSRALQRTKLLYIVGDKEAYFSPLSACRFAAAHYRGPFEVWCVPRGRHLTNHISGGTEYGRRITQALLLGVREVIS